MSYKSGRIISMHPSVGKGIIEVRDSGQRYAIPFYFVEGESDLKVGDYVSYLDGIYRAKQVRKLPCAREQNVITLTIGDKDE